MLVSKGSWTKMQEKCVRGLGGGMKWGCSRKGADFRGRHQKTSQWKWHTEIIGTRKSWPVKDRHESQGWNISPARMSLVCPRNRKVVGIAGPRKACTMEGEVGSSGSVTRIRRMGSIPSVMGSRWRVSSKDLLSPLKCYIEILNIIGHYRNVNQNCNEMLLHIY